MPSKSSSIKLGINIWLTRSRIMSFFGAALLLVMLFALWKIGDDAEILETAKPVDSKIDQLGDVYIFYKESVARGKEETLTIQLVNSKGNDLENVSVSIIPSANITFRENYIEIPILPYGRTENKTLSFTVWDAIPDNMTEITTTAIARFTIKNPMPTTSGIMTTTASLPTLAVLADPPKFRINHSKELIGRMSLVAGWISDKGGSLMVLVGALLSGGSSIVLYVKKHKEIISIVKEVWETIQRWKKKKKP